MNEIAGLGCHGFDYARTEMVGCERTSSKSRGTFSASKTRQELSGKLESHRQVLQHRSTW